MGRTATTISPGGSVRDQLRRITSRPPDTLTVPGLTIVAHPDSRRVGDLVALPELLQGREVWLSRLAPLFSSPERPTRRPLGDQHVSRSPIRLAPGPQEGDLLLDCALTRTGVEADGRPLNGGCVLSRGEIDRGVVLMLSRRVVLVLHLLPGTAPSTLPTFGLVGESRGVVRVRQEIAQAAALDVPVLLRGETGTGKDLVARAIHARSPRREKPFVAVNMGAVPVSLAASELFGAARGAFTGADRKKSGFFRHAQRGTLFLDEIGEAPLEVQGMLLRALESGEIQPVGSVERATVDVRVITATDAAIESRIAGGHFRGPLYYRLAGYLIRLPALRERREDIGRLLFHFLREEIEACGEGELFSEDGGRPWPPAEVVALLARYDWPGNVRELGNVARRLAIAYCTGAAWSLVPLLDELIGRPGAPPVAAFGALPGGTEVDPRLPGSALEARGVERSDVALPPPRRRRFRKPSEVSEEELLAALEAYRWRVKPTAAALGVSRATLYRLIEASSRVRKATELGRREIEMALERHHGDPVAAAGELEVSPEGLKLRMAALGVS